MFCFYLLFVPDIHLNKIASVTTTIPENVIPQISLAITYRTPRLNSQPGVGPGDYICMYVAHALTICLNELVPLVYEVMHKIYHEDRREMDEYVFIKV